MALVTLTSDFGDQDYLVAAVKARLMQIDPAFQLLDISHRITPFHYPQAAYICRSAMNSFPEYSFHLVLVNLFEQKPRQLLLAFHQHQYILMADNGLLPLIAGGKPELVIGLPFPASLAPNALNCVKLMGEAIHAVLAGTPLADLGEEDPQMIEKNPLLPFFTDQMIEGQILFIDHFENVIVNITHEQFEAQRQGRKFKIVFKRDEVIEQISTSYADVSEGEKLALFNSAGYLEIAINKGNAAGLFGLRRYSEKSQQISNLMQSRLFYQTVKVYFES